MILLQDKNILETKSITGICQVCGKKTILHCYGRDRKKFHCCYECYAKEIRNANR